MDQGLRVMSRYLRQMTLPEVGVEGQHRLSKAHVLVVGAGGLGCPVLQYLAGAGVGRITLLDPDHVEESNLHRQPLYRMSDLGCAKALAARAHLRAANPELTIDARVQTLHPGNAPLLVAAADVVVDAADSFAVSYMLSDTCHRQGVPLISASALGQKGYAGGFCGHGAPSLRAVFPGLPDRGATCASAGVLGPVVGMIGALQAQMTLQVLLQHTPSPLGQIVTLDMQRLRFDGFAFHAAPEPQIAAPFVSRSEIRPTDQLIELRGAEEAPEIMAPQAQRLSTHSIDDLQPDPAQRVVLCCASGLRAWRAAECLQAKGHDNLALLAATACE